MGTIFEVKSIGSANKKDKHKNLQRDLYLYLKGTKNRVSNIKGLIFPAFKIKDVKYYAMVKEDLENYRVPKSLIEDKVLFYGKTVYMCLVDYIDPVIEDYERQNEMMQW